MALITILLLGACGNTDDTIQDAEAEKIVYDNPRNHTAEDFMPISDGFEEYSLWIKTSNNPDRNSTLQEILLFKNGVVKHYRNISDEDKLTIEELMDLSDSEIVNYANEYAMTTDEGTYILDLTLDEMGQYTEKVNIVLENYIHTQTFDIETVYWESGLDSVEEYIASIEEAGIEFTVDGDFITFTTTEEERNSIVSIEGNVVLVKIFETTYAGLSVGEHDSVLTRVPDSFVGFRLNDSDTDKKNVTVEAE